MSRRRSTLVLVPLYLAVTATAVAASGELASEDELRALLKAESPSQMLAAVERAELAFVPEPELLDALRLEGTSEMVLLMIRAKGRRYAEEGIFRRVERLVSDQEPEAAVEALIALKAGGHWVEKHHYALVLTLLAAGRRDEAAREYESMAAAYPSGSPMVRQAGELLAAESRRREAVERVLAHLADLDPAAAEEALLDSGLAEIQKLVILYYIDLYQAEFVTALSRLFEIERSGHTGPDVDALRARLLETRKHYAGLWKEIEWHLESGLANSPCDPISVRNVMGEQKFSLPNYFSAVGDLLRSYPLNQRALDVAFHAALLTLDLREIEGFGRRILGGLGRLRIPFFDHNDQFWLVIDARSERIFLESYAAGKGAGSYDEDTLPRTDFDLAWSEVRKIGQKAAGSILTGGLEREAFALKLGPSGLAPHYSFMPLLHCLFGEEEQKRVTHNLGRFIADTVGGNVRLDLVNPNRVKKDWLQITGRSLSFASIGIAAWEEGALRAERSAMAAREEVDESLLRGQEASINQLRQTAGMVLEGSDMLGATREARRKMQVADRHEWLRPLISDIEELLRENSDYDEIRRLLASL